MIDRVRIPAAFFNQTTPNNDTPAYQPDPSFSAMIASEMDLLPTYQSSQALPRANTANMSHPLPLFQNIENAQRQHEPSENQISQSHPNGENLISRPYSPSNNNLAQLPRDVSEDLLPTLVTDASIAGHVDLPLDQQVNRQ